MNLMIYHLMIDRFAGVSGRRKGRCFKGGNLHDIIPRLDYIQSLGMTGIILTPFYRTAAYHGYHVTRYDEVDPHFGTWDDVRSLVAECHSRGMTVTADFVANHCHRTSHLIRDHPDWFIHNTDGSFKCFAGLRDLPMFDTDNPEVCQFMTRHLLRLCELGFDHIRLDHATGPTYSFWQNIRQSLKSQYHGVKLIGEVWGSMDFVPRTVAYEANAARFTAQEARQLEYVGVLDGVLDFAYQEMMCAAVREPWRLKNTCELETAVKAHFARYPANFDLWLFLDNHDLNRFLRVCAGNKRLLHDAIAFTQQWDNTFLYYYGTEKGFTNKKDIFGGEKYADENVRQIMKFN